MRCMSCGYPLWNIPSRSCPECGSGFKPSDFDLNPNSVRFVCPHCQQDYYGTDERGHLEPPSFDCVRCHTRIEMDEMILLPARGVKDAMTRGRQPEPNPWLRRREVGGSKAGWKTLGRSLVTPGSLMSAPPGAQARVPNAALFALIIMSVAALLTVAPFALLIGLGPGAPAMGVKGALAVAAAIVGVIAGLLVYFLIAGLVGHLVMVITGGAQGGLGRSVEASFYSSGPWVCTWVPCLNLYTFPVGPLWGGVSFGLMLRRAHDSSAVRGVIAGLVPPVLALLVATGVLVGLAMRANSGFTAARAMVRPTTSVTMTGSALTTYQLMGGWPAHGLEMVRDDMIEPGMVMGPGRAPTAVALPGIDVQTFRAMSSTEVATLTRDAVASLPDDTIAHRVGDLVFTYHGQPTDGTARLGAWTVVWAPHPSGAGATPGTGAGYVAIVTSADGSVQPFLSGAAFQRALQGENVARAGEGLAPLPDLMDFEWVATESAPDAQTLPDFTPP